MSFPFETTPVYQLSIIWANEVETLCQGKKGELSSGILDQLRRAALSVPLNVAEGYGRWHKGDKQQFYRVARGSVYECVPILEILRLRSVLTEAEHDKHYETLNTLAKMLSGLIKALEGE